MASRVQASRAELLAGLAELGAVEIQGRWRVPQTNKTEAPWLVC
jgi:hypothetical protein